MSLRFTGYYNINFFVDTYTIQGLSSIPVFIDKYPNSTTILVVKINRVNPIVTVDKKLLYEEYIYTTYEDSSLNIKLGSLTCNAVYPDEGQGIISEESIQNLTVLGADGIYAGINQVIINFKTPPIRKIEFIQNY